MVELTAVIFPKMSMLVLACDVVKMIWSGRYTIVIEVGEWLSSECRWHSMRPFQRRTAPVTGFPIHLDPQ